MHLDQLQQYIRFAISQLSPQNGQAEFEKICLYFAKARIHRNILPATGPVQAGGDQGRDFETFHTYLSETDIAGRAFLSNYSNRPVVFACSMEKNPTKKNGKITSDIRTIMAKGTTVDRIYFFSGQDVAVAARHRAIADAKREHNVDLEIIDANGLSQGLAEPDLFWVTTQFLKVPADMYPFKHGSGWYEDLLKEYRQDNRQISSYEEFTEVKNAIRSIYKDDQLKSDLPFWHGKLDELISITSLDSLARTAIYERFVTAFVGTEYVEGQESNIKRYFENFEEFISNSELEDANHLLTFCTTAFFKGRLNVEKIYLENIADRMEALLTKMIEAAVTHDNRCALLEIMASFDLSDRRGQPDIEFNFQNYVSSLNELADILKYARYFPVERLADRLNKNLPLLIRMVSDIEPLEHVIKKVDEELAKHGATVLLAEKLRDRAVAFFEVGQYEKALGLFHELKIKWFNQGTIDGVVITCTMIGKIYKKQGLYFAAK